MSGPIYTYTLCTPDSASPMNQTQPLIQENFQAMNELIGVNHVDFNTLTTFGMHNFLSLPMQSSLPVTVSTDINVFSQLTPSGPNVAEIFATFADNNPTIQISAIQTGGGAPVGTTGTGWSKFGTSGTIMKWGTGTVTTSYGNQISAGSNATFTYPTGSGIPAFSRGTAYVKITPTISQGNDFGAVSAFQSPSQGKISIRIQTIYPVTFSFNWFAIGI